MPRSTYISDPWTALRHFTSARIALGRAGGSLPTAQVLDFAVAHAAARDAVHAELDAEALLQSLRQLGVNALLLATRAADRETYLRRPDLGRRLDDPSRDLLTRVNHPECDASIIVADGLSAPAAQHQAQPVLRELLPRLAAASLTPAPLCVVRQARVAVEDEIGQLLRARVALILIGERPGLGSAESLGGYLVFNPRPGNTDAQRNCVSNIRPGGQSPAAAADILYFLITESLRRRLSGVSLKDDRGPVLPARPAQNGLA
jgi:ethanolamine ammonia-lyase small subunit